MAVLEAINMDGHLTRMRALNGKKAVFTLCVATVAARFLVMCNQWRGKHERIRVLLREMGLFNMQTPRRRLSFGMQRSGIRHAWLPEVCWPCLRRAVDADLLARCKIDGCTRNRSWHSTTRAVDIGMTWTFGYATCARQM